MGGRTTDRPIERRRASATRPYAKFVAQYSEGAESFRPEWEESLMQNLAWYQGESLKRLLQGAAVGVVASLAIGFGWGGWMLGSTAKTLADDTASSAVVAAIAPI